MKELKEKAFTVNVDLNEHYPDAVQIMLKHLYNDGTLRYDDIHLDGTDVVSDGYYKDLKYGCIDDDALSRKTAIEDEGYRMEYIFTITEKQQDPFIDGFGIRPNDFCIREETSYSLKLKFSFTKLVEIDEDDNEPETGKKARPYIIPTDKAKMRKKKRTTRLVAPF